MQNTVLITGAAKRIGRALALDFAQKSWRVIIHYRSSGSHADDLVELIKSRDGQAWAVAGDFRLETAPETIIEECLAKAGPITCLINNASLFERDDIRSMSPESWVAHMDINLRAPVFLAQAFAKQLPEGTQGNIINILDQKVWNLTPEFLSYTTSKSALLTLTKTLAQALSPTCRVNAIGPGPTLPNARQSKQDFQAQVDATLLKRATSLEEICAAAQFILASPSLTGQMIALDSGEHLVRNTAEGGFHE
jgi:NAD(P)-dependent dehydrogenase (short-subunit alcohol dehydrogenase family)